MSEEFAVAINRMALDSKLQQGDRRWSEFNGSFENKSLEPIDLANEIYTGHAYTSWHSPTYRKAENWFMSQFIAVDMDTGDQRSSLRVLSDNDMIQTYATLIHTTPSHTPEHPRARVVFLLDRPINNPVAYGNACKFMTQLIGGDEVATDPSRFFYGKSNCEIELLHNTLSTDHLYTLYQRTLRHREPVRRPLQNQAQHRSITQQRNADMAARIEEALSKIDPWDVDYNDWFRIIAAIKNELGESGLDLAVRWAAGRDGEVERKWQSIKRKSGMTTHFGTIAKFAYLK